MALAVGSRLAHYDVTALIGEGGHGAGLPTGTRFDCDVALQT